MKYTVKDSVFSFIFKQPEILRLSAMYDGPGSAEVEIKVLRNMGSGNIVDQYIRFCEISDAQRT